MWREGGGIFFFKALLGPFSFLFASFFALLDSCFLLEEFDLTFHLFRGWKLKGSESNVEVVFIFSLCKTLTMETLHVHICLYSLLSLSNCLRCEQTELFGSNRAVSIMQHFKMEDDRVLHIRFTLREGNKKKLVLYFIAFYSYRIRDILFDIELTKEFELSDQCLYHNLIKYNSMYNVLMYVYQPTQTQIYPPTISRMQTVCPAGADCPSPASQNVSSHS